MLINTLSKQYHISVRTLRYYEEIGLLNSERNESNIRYYTQDQIKRLEEVLMFKSLGFKLVDIKAILNDNQTLNQQIHSQLTYTKEKIQEFYYQKNALESILKTYGSDDISKRNLESFLNEQIYVKKERWSHMTDSKALTIEIGINLVPIAIKENNISIFQGIIELREECQKLHDIDLPPVRIRDINELSPESYQIRVGEEVVYTQNLDDLDAKQQVDHILTQLKAIIIS